VPETGIPIDKVRELSQTVQTEFVQGAKRQEVSFNWALFCFVYGS